VLIGEQVQRERHEHERGKQQKRIRPRGGLRIRHAAEDEADPCDCAEGCCEHRSHRATVTPAARACVHAPFAVAPIFSVYSAAASANDRP
jgi:hypothetical protein